MKYKIKTLFKTDISKLYIIGVGIICLLLIGGFFSYAMFTVSKEKKNAISIVTGNLVYELEVDGVKSNTITIDGSTTKEYTITLTNPNNRIARFNFYYVGELDSNIEAGYVASDGFNTPPVATGINLEKSGASGSSNTYKIRVTNKSTSSKTITLGVEVGLDYNDLTLPSNGHLFDEVQDPIVSEVVLANVGDNGSTYDDGTDTFIIGEEPNNYIWYSGKLWRAVSVNNEEKTTKLVTQWNISAITYSSGSTDFDGSFMEDWLNDTSVDGFLGNLRDYENFIVTDSKWNATLTTSSSKPESTTIVEDAVGLLNYYEYVTSYKGTTYSNGYLNNGLYWWILTPYTSSNVRFVRNSGNTGNSSPLSNSCGARPSVNLKSSVRIVDGDGTIDNPYRLKGDNDKDLSGTKLNTRYSGEYISFGTGENNLYMIVSHETEGLTKIASAEPLKDSGTFKTSTFGSNTTFSSTNTIGTFLNGDYLTSYVGETYSNMIEDSTTWYLGTVGSGISYKLAKYTDTTSNILTSSTATAKVGLLRLGELGAGQFERYAVKGGSTSTGLTTTYWTLIPYTSSSVRYVSGYGNTSGNSPSGSSFGARPSLNLKSNVVITGGDGTKENPFEIQLGS